MKDTLTKRLLSVILTAILVFGLVPLSAVDAFAAGASDLIFQINETDDGYIVYECNQAASGKLTIPSYYKSLPVVGIGNYAFIYCKDLTVVEIPNTVISIGECAFVGCTSLKSLTIPETVLAIGTYAYGWDYNPSNDSFYPVSMRTVSGFSYSIAHDYCFLYNVEFKSIGKVSPLMYALNDSGDGYVLQHYSAAYESNSFDVPDTYNGLPVTEVGIGAFMYCVNLLTVSFPDSVIRISDGAFFGCVNLESAPIPNTVESIGISAFDDTKIYKCGTWQNGMLYYDKCLIAVREDELPTKIEINNSTRIICDYAFLGDLDISEVYIPASVENIGDYSFAFCIGIKKVSLLPGVKRIGECAFAEIRLLDSVTIPESVTEIGAYAFGYHYNSEGDEMIVDGGFVINGVEGSVAQKYANENKIKFNAITVIYGDANGDDKVDLRDVVLLRQYMANYVYATGASTVQVKPGADANGDGKVDLKDVVLLRQYMANYSYYTESSTVVLGPR